MEREMVVHELVGGSEVINGVVRFIAKAAPAISSVLIYGESGTGKELVARALHSNSRRAAGPFVAINCAALPEHLLESELFGHERGAFTGALTQQKGKFELASGGTIFLDEVGELNASIQAKLLRAIQERKVDRIGGSRPIPVDVRFIAATNRDLESAVAAGTFRGDLYYRLKVLSLRMPPLRERRDDISVIARHFLTRFALENGVAAQELSEETLAILEQYDWPGNVRELQNVIEHAVVLGSSPIVLPEDLPQQILKPAAPQWTEQMGMREMVEEVERWLYKYAFSMSRGVYVGASAILKVNPKGIHRSLKNLGLSHLLK
jgi:two-component system NtrC family response regulator